MDTQKTSFLYRTAHDYLGKSPKLADSPRLFVCCEHEIMEFPLEGHQTLGRPGESRIPDIPVTNRFVSRDHGCFDTSVHGVTYTASDTTNGTIFRRKVLAPGETVELWDGDELIIPVASHEDSVDILLVCAFVENRVKIWRDLRLASRDSLTGLSGRNTFKTWYLQNYYLRDVKEACLFIIDIDFFKRINDVYGHSAGDNALKLLTEKLLRTVGPSGYVCRWGGDEFVGVMRGRADEVSRRLADMSKSVHDQKIGGQFQMTVSAGMVDINEVTDREDIDSLVILADQALYQAKEKGKNRICIYKNA